VQTRAWRKIFHCSVEICCWWRTTDNSIRARLYIYPLHGHCSA
jgi:hypothetical protein